MNENSTLLSLRNQILTNSLLSGIDLTKIQKSYKSKLNYSKVSNTKKAEKNLLTFLDSVKQYFEEQKIEWDDTTFNMVDFHSILTDYSNNIHPTIDRKTFIDAVGKETLKESIKDVVVNGENYRPLTERQLRSKVLRSDYFLTKLLPEIIEEFTTHTEDHSIENFFVSLAAQLIVEPTNSEQFKIALSLLGLTKKGLDNILDNNPWQLYNYCLDLSKSITEFVNQHFNKKVSEVTNDEFEYTLQLLSISSLSLAIRGSMKSMVGKLFERLILGTSLSLLGLKYLSTPPTYTEKEYSELCDRNQAYFWLSSKEKNGREKDATIMYRDKIIDIDIGLIGKGNPEIAADKLSRFKPEYKFKNRVFPAKTIILIGRVNNGKIIQASAHNTNGKVIEITNNNQWLFELNKYMLEFISPEQDLRLNTDFSTLGDQINQIDIEKFIN